MRSVFGSRRKKEGDTSRERRLRPRTPEEKVIEYIEEHDLQIGFDSLDLLDRPNTGIERHIAYARKLLGIVLNRGVVIAYGKLPGEFGREQGDFGNVFVGGRAKDWPQLYSTQVTSSLQALTLAYTMANYGGFIGERTQAAVFAHLQDVPVAVESLSVNVAERSQSAVKFPNHEDRLAQYEQYNQDMAALLVEIASRDKNKKKRVMSLVHTFQSQSRMRGHNLPIKMMYLLPGDVGLELEQRILQDPWVVEALSELTRKQAGKELHDEQPRNFSYPYVLNKAERRQESSMFGASVTEQFWKLFAFYSTR